MTLTNHWGVFVDSEKPVTGVMNSSDIAWEWICDERCLTCEEILEEAQREAEASDEDAPEDLGDYIECDSQHTKIIGDWREDAEGKLEPDPDGEFAAIVGEEFTQVVFSKATKRCALCSPCFPGQGDLDTPGDFLAYDLPENLKYD